MVAVLLAGCAYSFSARSLPSHIKTIAIPVFRNETLDGTIAQELTQGIAEKFMEDNSLRVVGPGRADCVLEGKVVAYERRVYNYTADQQAQDYVLVVSVSIVLKDRVKNKDLWSEDEMTATAVYPATEDSGVVTEASSEEEARKIVVEKLAQDVLARTLERW